MVVLEREATAGGIPRHSGHQGFGLRDLRRVMSGPQYARRYVELARQAGTDVQEETMVTALSTDRTVETTSPRGRETLRPPALVLATGCRERPRAARLVPGSRPDGVMTTGLLQQRVYLLGERLRGRALVVGAEHVSFSAVLTLAQAGARVVGMTTELPRQQSFAIARFAAAARYRMPVWTRTAVAAIHGTPHVEEAELVELDSGRKRRVACDLVVFTDDWIPDHELAVMAGIELDSGTRGPRVDTGLRTALRGVFVAGNALHGAEPADVAALSGRRGAASVADWLENGTWPGRALPIVCEPPLQWIAPNAISAVEPPPRARFVVRASAFLRGPTLEITQDGRRLWEGRMRRLMPGRSASVPWAWIRRADFAGGSVTVGLAPR